MASKEKNPKPAPELEQEEIVEEGAQEQCESVSDETVVQKSEVDELTEQLATANDKLLRTMAEYDNFRRRSQKEKESIYPQATANAVAQFVPILDTFERALDAPCNDLEFKKGVEMILQNFQEVLAKEGVEAFGEAGEQFNPDIHNAVMHVDDESLEANVITDVFQRGYRIGDRIIRHAMVKVAN